MAVPLRLAATLALGLFALPAPAEAALSSRAQSLLARSDAWTKGSVAALGRVRADASPLESAGNILAVYVDRADELSFRVSLVAPVGIIDQQPHFERERIQILLLLDEGPGGRTELPGPLRGPAPFAWDRAIVLDRAEAGAQGKLAESRDRTVTVLDPDRARFHLVEGWLAATIARADAEPTQIAVLTISAGRELDRLVAPLAAQLPTFTTNVAWVHHGNQGLAYTDVFKGRSGAENASGFDEILEIHQLYNIPGNFHLSALLQSAAEWNVKNGDPLDINQFLRTGVTQGWAGMVASAYGQPITPFLQGAMNDWAIDRDVAMVSFRYSYVPHVAWVPERTWLTPGQYPSNGVVDASGPRWKSHGIDAVILDDGPHCSGHDNHQIHFVPGTGLRIIARDANFTGAMHAGNGAGALQILTDLANNPVGPFRLVVYADDWEMAAEVAGWETTFPNALDAYEFMIAKCQTESAWLNTWKLDPALANPNFNGDTFNPINGTYGSIGGGDGYGGSNNAWYGDYAGYVPYSNGGNGNGGCAGSGGNCRNHGQLWNDAHAALQAAPNNNIREAGWYVMMTNLHETGWHDFLGGPLSGWQRQYAGHIKNANIYAEAARWAGGLYASTSGAFFSDIDNDGFNELVIHNDRVFGVFESIGGRCTHLFAKGNDYNYSVVGIDNAYWAGTEGDYNDVNHIAALSDVGPNTQHDLYAMNIVSGSGSTVKIRLTRAGVDKTVSLTLGQPYLDCVYRVGSATQYVQSGWSPDLVDLLYNAEMDRVYGPGAAYVGRRNPNTSATAAYVLGQGGAAFNLELGGTLMKGDEIYGTQKFEFYVYAGYASPPAGGGAIPELETLAAGLTDLLAPEAVRGTYFPATHQLALTFDEPVRWNTVVPASIAIDADNNGAADVTLDGSTSVINTANAATLTLQVSNAVHNAIQALPDKNQLRLLLQAGAVEDGPGNDVAALTHAGNVFVSYGPPTLITLDGLFGGPEWPNCTAAVLDTLDSQWNALPSITNEIQAIHATWDSLYLYLGIRGVATQNSWLLYLDTDPGGLNGQVDLRAINVWERGVQFTAPGFRADWGFGAYQHQGPFDSQSFFKILSATTTANYTDSILKAFDPSHVNGLNGGSELAIPWSVLFGLGPGRVPSGAQLGLVASLCFDPEPGGEAGGDQAPNNTGGVLPPTLNNRHLLALDANADGYPDPIDRTPPALLSATPTGYDSVIVLQFSEPLLAGAANQTSRYAVFQTANSGQFLTVKSATLQADPAVVRLIVSPMENVNYTVTASGLSDVSCFQNTVNLTSASLAGPPVAVGSEGGSRHLELAVPYPNPTLGRSMIEFAVRSHETDLPVTLDVFDLGGRHLRRIASGAFAPGRHRVAFDGATDQGERLAPGVYFVRLSRGAQSQLRRLVILP